MERLTKVVDSKIYLSDEFFSQIRDGKLSKDQAFGVMVKHLAEMEEFYAKIQSSMYGKLFRMMIFKSSLSIWLMTTYLDYIVVRRGLNVLL